MNPPSRASRQALADLLLPPTVVVNDSPSIEDAANFSTGRVERDIAGAISDGLRLMAKLPAGRA
jgi:hypothetical protein